MSTFALADDPLLKDGQKVAFLGDSITQQGASSPAGYVRLVISGLEANGIKISSVPAGISGNKSPQMLARLEKDVLSKKPDWMTLSCGVNDVWHGERGVALEDYKANIVKIIDTAYAAGVKVVILTATPIGEDLPNDNNKKLAAYNDVLREIAKEKGCPLADLSAGMIDELTRLRAGREVKGNLLTADGVHMNPLGNRVMATGVLAAFGLDADQLDRAKAAWLDAPKTCEINGRLALTFRQYERLSEIAAERGKSVNDLVNEAATRSIDSLLATPTTAPSTR